MEGNNLEKNRTKDLETIKVAYKALDDKFAIDIKVLDISQSSTIADYFIIASGNNISQVKAMADEVDLKLHEIGVDVNHREGYTTSNWILLDFSNVIVHLFNKEDRQYYDLEKAWGNAKEIDVNTI